MEMDQGSLHNVVTEERMHKGMNDEVPCQKDVHGGALSNGILAYDGPIDRLLLDGNLVDASLFGNLLPCQTLLGTF